MARRGQIVESIPEGAEHDGIFSYATLGCMPCDNSVTIEFAGIKSGLQEVAKIAQTVEIPHTVTTSRGVDRVGGTACRDACPFAEDIPAAVELIREQGLL